MDYAAAAQAAPAGWRRFDIEDLYRLPASVARRALMTVPSEERRRVQSGDADARERMRRALFWTFVYHLEAARWDELARAEPIHPDLLAELPSRVESAVDLGAGTGRLTAHLVTRSRRVVAVEPALGMARLLRANVPDAMTLSAWAEALPITSGWSELTVACGAFGPDPAILGEMERITRDGGFIALISPELPETFEAMGWRRLSMPPPTVPPHEQWIDDFFGPPDPPHEIVIKRRHLQEAAR
ncbi:MAG TPA: methyltransferase domain-containing protein [Gaiellales bacterium]|nr:methyltransferase domain-containing protein [Gaiellales bacterium]